MASRNQYRGKDGRFERCTIEKLFGVRTNPGYRYRCTNCGYIFTPILADGNCPKCRNKEAIQKGKGTR